ncbi:CRTAC1 family protein [Candidatus Poribacteria bacterium]|nr:CRTAC1 family protein [Candidatus Poribacteria bacterium]MYG07430.1 CRTAC1 family protein [Candidatus Poribacteria bacterium]MYK21274.1 CRTAC1 family protein [Candidatus Poribacteria bacterium]
MGGRSLDSYLTIKQELYFVKKFASVLKSVKLESQFNAVAILAHSITFLIFLSLNATAQNLPQFTDITRAAGIDFIHNSGAFGQKYLPETMGSGCAFIDYNTDGWQDILLVNGKDWKGNPTGKRQTMALYRNNRDGTFTDATEAAGLAAPLYGMGVAVADYDNDGDPDIYISCLETDRLFQNNGDGTFADATKAAGIHNPGFGTSCAWFDYNNDGHLDLYVANYVEWSIENDLFCTLNGINKSYCTPESYQGQASKLFRNRGDGTFADVSRSARIEDKTSKSLGVCIFDYNADGLPDIFEANDTQPNKLYQNNGDSTFIETALEVGVSHDEKGVATGAMGVDAADYDRTGRESLVIGNFSNEMLNLYHNDGGFFIDDAPAAQIGNATLLTLTFACFFFDFDLDGNLDIFTANGHVENDINAIQMQVTYAQPPHLFHNNSHGKFSDVRNKVGSDLAKPMVGRGAAYGDIDNDGDWDLLVTTSNGPAHLFRNDGGNRNTWIKFQLVGQTSNRDGIGAQIRITTASGTQIRRVKSGSSYCSQSELTTIFGINNDTLIETIEVKWPSGAVSTRKNIKPNQHIHIEEVSP